MVFRIVQQLISNIATAAAIKQQEREQQAEEQERRNNMHEQGLLALASSHLQWVSSLGCVRLAIKPIVLTLWVATWVNSPMRNLGVFVTPKSG